MTLCKVIKHLPIAVGGDPEPGLEATGAEKVVSPINNLQLMQIAENLECLPHAAFANTLELGMTNLILNHLTHSKACCESSEVVRR
jgi:hypothetical protein